MVLCGGACTWVQLLRLVNEWLSPVVASIRGLIPATALVPFGLLWSELFWLFFVWI